MEVQSVIVPSFFEPSEESNCRALEVNRCQLEDVDAKVNAIFRTIDFAFANEAC
jgi:hypothetical protein